MGCPHDIRAVVTPSPSVEGTGPVIWRRVRSSAWIKGRWRIGRQLGRRRRIQRRALNAGKVSFEEVIHLLWHGRLPTQAELNKLTTALRAERDHVETLEHDLDLVSGLSSSIQSSRHSGNSVLWPAIRPLNKAPHLIPPQIAQESYRENQIQQRVFTQPGSQATNWFRLQHFRFAP